MGDPLRAFLSGKRSAKRHALRLPVLLYGRAVQVCAESVDVSANGVLVAVAIAEALPGVKGPIEVAAFSWLQQGFPDGLHIAVPAASVALHADPVRTNVDPDDPRRLLIGCRLRRALTDRELERLGLRPEECGPENAVSDASPERDGALRVRSSARLSVTLFTGEARKRIAEGKLVAVGAQSLSVRLPVRPQDVMTHLGCLDLYFEVRRRKKLVWASNATVTALPTPVAGGVELGLWADTGPRRPIVSKDELTDGVRDEVAPSPTGMFESLDSLGRLDDLGEG